MQRLTISLPDSDAATLRREARQRGVSVSKLVRERIRRERIDPATGHRIIPWAGMYRGDGSFSAADLDDYLAKHWADDIMRHRDR